MTRYATPRRQPARAIRNAFMTGPYACPELGRTCCRPGAYDAYDLPSLIGGRLHYPDGRVVDRGAAAPQAPRPSERA